MGGKTMENRIEQKMQNLKTNKEKALITYMTAGLPDMAGSKALVKAQEQAGTDSAPSSRSSFIMANTFLRLVPN